MRELKLAGHTLLNGECGGSRLCSPHYYMSFSCVQYLSVLWSIHSLTFFWFSWSHWTWDNTCFVIKYHHKYIKNVKSGWTAKKEVFKIYPCFIPEFLSVWILSFLRVIAFFKLILILCGKGKAYLPKWVLTIFIA